jgi:hypothetical protein
MHRRFFVPSLSSLLGATFASLAVLAACSSTTTTADAPPSCSGDGCADQGDDGGGPDAAGPDGAKAPSDPPLTGCRTLDAFPGGVAIGAYLDTQANAPPRDTTMGMLRTDDQGLANSLNVEVVQARSKLPVARTLTHAEKLATCDACFTITEGCDDSSACKTVFLAVEGEISVTRADKDPSAGRVTASGSKVVFAEWDSTKDARVPNGKCIAVGNIDLAAHWGSAGACDGTACGSAASCCSAAPFCLPVGGGHHVCSSTCSASYGAGAGNCGGPQDCCAGFKCFLGSCMDDTCIGRACTAGFGGAGTGACCATAPYCTGDSTGLKCRLACGDPGARCAADADCCTGTTCKGGTCG